MGQVAARLRHQLLTSNLQITNNALYQVIATLIGLVDSLESTSPSSGGSSGGSTTIVLQNLISIPGEEGEQGEDGSPGPIGPAGISNTPGPQGPMGAIIFPPDAEDGDMFPPIVGPQGNAGPTGAQGPVGVSIFPEDGLDGEDGIPGPPGASGGNTNDTFAVAASDESVTSNTTPQDDDELFLSVEANSVYIFELVLWLTSGTSNSVDINWDFTFPASATFTCAILDFLQSATAVTTVVISSRYQESTPSLLGTGGVLSTTVISASPLLLKGVLRTGANAGTLQFRFAQGNSSLTALVRKADSYLHLTKVA